MLLEGGGWRGGGLGAEGMRPCWRKQPSGPELGVGWKDGWLEKGETCSKGEKAEEILRCWATGGGPVDNL